MSDKIWCTLVTLNDNYACGAAVMAESLRIVKTVFFIWCMVTDDVSELCQEWLKSVFDNVIVVPLTKRSVTWVRPYTKKKSFLKNPYHE